MKKEISCLLSFLLLPGLCAFPAGGAYPVFGAETSVHMSYSDFPHIDGSLACVPLIENLAKELTGCTDAQAEEILYDFSNTNPCYINLAEGERDICLAYEASEETKEELLAYPALTMDEIGRDGLVFIVNEDNPVDSLSVSQLYDIFTGKITNWKEVGGWDQPIKAFSRPENSGSQTLIRKFLVHDEDIVGHTEMVASMEGMIEQLARYDNSANAIGFSVYYYASAMFAQPGLRFLAVNGVLPSQDTIKSGEYPFVNPFFCVTGPSSAPQALTIRDWLLSEEGQAFVEENGYVPAG